MSQYRVRRPNIKNPNVFERKKNINKTFDNMSKSEKLLNGVDVWTSFYRENPHRFVKDYLGINLKTFQKILIFMMNHFYYFMYIASRG